ncbi:hypothetical protein GCM10012288_24900 [Malaciobacter pacificus]|uniref:Uncharacterized protein n=1 Tax=Malaciobacter pacificus TaxID=1080223 RepID=A0A5C2H7Y2_9BACT|nr:hypothetical protein [Malaciobacter pacificus]QEP35047.1 hypothetical protein APAC_1975 [Malaciobacter pacificus]GGD49890.1 hypothetical protein GCM10012288_24900 [Malaciobacter pacificus]
MSKLNNRLKRVLESITDIDFILKEKIEDKILKAALNMNIIIISEQFTKLKDDNEFNILKNFSNENLKAIDKIKDSILNDYENSNINDFIQNILPGIKNSIIYLNKFGIQIIMNEEKIINDNKYDLHLIYKEIDRLAEFAGMKKIDKHNYISKNDSPSELGCFIFSNLQECEWFMDNVKKITWFDPEDGIQDVLEHIKSKRDRK